MSQQFSTDLGEHLIELGHNFGLNTDTLVSALNAMSNTLIRSAAAYGKETSEAVMKATSNLVASYGDASKDMITSIANKLFAGTAASEKLLNQLGISLERAMSTDADVLAQVVVDASRAFNEMRGGSEGGMGSGTLLTALENSFELGDVGSQMVALAKGGAADPNSDLTAEQIEAQSLSNNIMANINETMANLTEMIMPVMSQVATILAITLPPIVWILKTILPYVVAFAGILTGIWALTKVMKIVTVAKWIWERAKDARVYILSVLNLAANSGVMANTMIIGLGVGALIMTALVGNMIANTSSGTSKDNLEENKKQTNILSKQTNDSKSMLQQIANAVNQSVIYQAQTATVAENTLALAESESVKETPEIDAIVSEGYAF